MSEDGSLQAGLQVVSPVTAGTLSGYGDAEGPLPRGIEESAATPAGNEVQVYSGGILVSQGTVLTGETIVGGANNSMFVYNGGTANSTTVNSSAVIHISRGGVADRTAVDSCGRIKIYSGGTANSTVLSGSDTHGSYGGMDLYLGGTANDTFVSSGGYMNISGVANGVDIYALGDAAVLRSGSADDISVSSNGTLSIYRDARATRITASNGAFLGMELGKLSYIQGSYAGSAFEIQDGTVENYTINWGYLHLRDETTAKDITVKARTWMRIFDGHAANTILSSGGSYYVYEEGTAQDTIVSSGGSMFIEGGKHTHTLTIAEGAFVSAYTGGVIDFTVSARSVSDGYLINDLSLIQGTPAYTITVNADQAAGTYKLAQGASNFTQTVAIGTETVNYGSITANGADFVYNGVTYSLDQVAGNLTLTIGAAVPTGDQVQVYSSGTLVKQGTVLTGETIVSGANNSMFVYNGGTANSTTVNTSGRMYIYSGGVANSTTVNSGGSISISSDGVANSTTVNSGGDMNLYSGGVANSTTVNTSGRMYVSSGGVANSTTVSGSSGCLTVLSNGVANDTVVNDCGSMSVLRESVANDTAVNSRSFMYVYSSGMANRTTVNNRGRLNVYSSGVANDTVVNSGGFLYIHSGAGAANDTIVSSGGSMSVVSGGKHCVTLTMEAGAVVSAYEGGIIDFTVSEWNTTAGYLINDLSLIQGTPAYTITVNADQAAGTYKLAQGASNFTQTVAIGTETVNYGSITANGADFVYNGVTYSLDQVAGNLTLTIGAAVPTGDQVQVYSSGTLVKQGTVLTGETIVGGANNSMFVFSGGTANSTTVNSFGNMYVSGGGSAASVWVTSGGTIYIYGEEYAPTRDDYPVPLHGIARGVTVSSGGSALISGGEVTGLMVSSGGYASVTGVEDTSAVDVNCMLFGGEIKYGGTFTIGNRTEFWGSAVFGGTVTINGWANVHDEVVFDLSERSAADTYIVDDITGLNLTEFGSYTISVSDNQANGTYKLAGNAASFSDTITVEGTALSVNGAGAIIGDRQYTLAVTDSILTLTIGTAPAGDQVQVYSSGTLVKQGTVLTGETIVGGANNSMFVFSGGTANITTVNSDGWLRISSGGVANSTTVNASGWMNISSGGVANSTTLSGNATTWAQAGHLRISSGGVANETTVDFGGRIDLYGGAVNGAVLNSGGVLTAQGGTASQVTINNGAVFLYSGAVLIDAANNGGTIAVSSGGVASNIFAGIEATASSGYALTRVSSGGVANTVELGNRGYLFVSGGGFASGVSIRNSGTMLVRGEEYTPEGGEIAEALYGSAKNVTVYSGGWATVIGGEVSGLLVSSGGIASAAGVADVSAVDVYGKLYGGEIKYGGTLTIGSGGVELWEDTVFGGTVTVNSWANIYGELVFDLSERSGEDTYIVDNIANLNLTEIGCYSVTVSDNQANGTYKLAGNAASFSDTITVAGESLTVNGTGVTIGSKQYTLAVTDSILTLTIGAADQVPPVLTISGNAVEWTNKDVVLTVECDDKEASVSYRVNGGSWQNCSGSVTVSANCTIEFKAVDAAGNAAVETVVVDRIDKMAPTAPVVTADVTELTNSNVTLTADFGDAITKEYSFNSRSWYTYTGSVVLSSNSSVYFRGTDHVGNVSEISSYKVDNIDKKAPGIPGNITFAIDKDSVLVDWADAADNGPAGTKGYYFRYGNSANLTGTGTFSSVSNIQLEDLAVGTWYFQIAAVDSVGNISQWSTVQNFEILPAGPENPVGDADGLKWDAVPGAKGYVVEYSTDDFATVISVETPSNSLDSFALPETTFKWRVRALEDEAWSYGNEITGKDVSGADKLVSDRDGVKDLFFANAEGVWEDGFAAQHLGFGSWQGTWEKVLLAGKNKMTDIFEGSSDASVLVLTDDSNGDALFVDDIYSALGTSARLAQISEIRAGGGDDIVDMTSQRYEYSGSSIRICGGDGNDTIWGAAGSNALFGDRGNDRLVGGSGNDVIAGGAGNDSMHGGGGDDIFTFGGNWGNDVVEQYAAGSVTLYLGSGVSGSWNADTRTWSDGINSIRVVGTENISIKFYETSEISESGAFEEQVSRKIFEDSGSGFIA